jgi:hypothetical protein
VGRALAGLCFAAVALLGACTDPEAVPEGSWRQSYTATTCGDWRDAMTERERRIAAGELLFSARRGHGASSFPSEREVRSYAAEISLTCKRASARIADVALGVYLISRPRYDV